jgi:RNA polymerase subunit RPABC4/transcription elongation factor Spt4
LNGVLHSSALRLAVESLVLLAAVLWLGLGFRVHRDARRRIHDGFLVALATVLGFGVPFLGPLLYLLFRPPETLEEARVRRVELLALRDRVGRPEPVCPVCRTEVEDDYLVCPVCTSRLKQACTRCDAALDPLWQVCPYCTAPLEALPAFDLDAALTAEAAAGGERLHRGARPLS